MAESFFATLECELLDRRRFKAQAEARIAIFEFIEGFYNPRRRHSSLGYLSPTAFEDRAFNPDAHEPAVVLAPVNERPGSIEPSRNASLPAVLERPCARRPSQCAGRDGKMIQAEQKDQTEQEDKMPSNWIP